MQVVVDCDQRAKSAEQRAQDVPQQPAHTAGLDVDRVSRAVVSDTVCRAEPPDDTVDTAGDEGQEEELEQAGGLATVFLADKVQILCQAV